jgi:alpha-galactosidase
MSKSPHPSLLSRGLLLAALAASAPLHAQEMLARLPPMGWNSWNIFHGDIDETKIRQIIDAMVSTGMRDAGYKNVNLDDNWHASPARDASGNLIAHPVRFKSGIKALADYAHSKGMRLGIYGDRGSMTCMNIPQSGSYGNEDRDAKTFASWGVDYLKYDNCNVVGDMRSDYTKMSNALKTSGRNIVFSVCAWQTQDWMPQVGQLWRSTYDITADWVPPPNSTLGWSIMTNLDGNAGNFLFTRPGSWADPDMLEVGNGRLTEIENKAHFGLWALMAAPLVAGNDIRNITKPTLAILTHPEVIAIDQDSAGVQGRRIRKEGDFEVWAKPLGTNYETWAIGLFNRSASASTMSIRWSELGLDPASVLVRDVWEKKDLGNFKDVYSVQVPSHGLALVKVTGRRDPAATIWVSDLHIHSFANAWKFLGVDKSVAGNAMKIGSKSYTKGLGAHAASRTELALRKKYGRFQADIGIDAGSAGGSAIFQVFGDGKKLYESPVRRKADAALAIDIPVEGVDSLALVVTDGGDGNTNDHADWAGAKLILSSTTGVGTPSSTRRESWNAILRAGDLVVERSDSRPDRIRLLSPEGRILGIHAIEGTSSRIPVGTLPEGVLLVESTLLGAPPVRIVVRR